MKSDSSFSDTLRRLAERMDDALAVITGRSVKDADRILGGCVRQIYGVHGREWRTRDGMHVASKPAGDLNAVREQAHRWASSLPFDLLVEDKGAAVAFHYRQAPEAASLVRSKIEGLAREHDLAVLHGKMVSELLSVGPTKGEAVNRLMAAPPFAGRTPIAVGDDATDEDAFAAAMALGGLSVRVGAGKPSAAQYSLPTVSHVRAWLATPLAGPDR